MSTLPLTLLGISALVSLVLYFAKRKTSYGLPFPPGPKGDIFFGNLLQIPASQPWKLLQEWSKQYGDVILVKLPLRATLILCSAKAAFDLLDKRSNIYSDRPRSVMDELSSWTFNFAMMRYTPRWRQHRRMFHQYFHKGMIKSYEGLQRREVHRFLRRVLDGPNDLNIGHEVRKIFSAIIVNAMYGIDTTGDEYAHLAEISLRGFSEFHIPGAYWVEYFPILRHVPSWIPGVKFKKAAEYYRPYVEKMMNQPFDLVKASLDSGDASPSITESLLRKLEVNYGGTSEYAEQEEIARNATAIGYGAAADTSTCAAQVFLIAMAFNPEVQKKAQQEIHSVVGSGRLPDSNDRDSLPYVQAIILETLRWKPVVPLNTPHALIEDNEYRGFLIPKDTVVIANIWAMMHDPEMYPEPERFNPSRFLKDGKLNSDILSPLSLAFGFGRRICPGRHFSDASLFLAVSSILQVFDIVLDPEFHGEDVEMTTGLISVPTSVPCILNPRSQAAERLVRGLPTW